MRFGTDDRSLKSRITRRIGGNITDDTDVQLSKIVNYNFASGIVKEVVSNPYDYLNRKIKDSDYSLRDILARSKSGKIENDKEVNISVENYQMLKNMPMNSLIVYLTDDNKSKDGKFPIVAYPFFPSHFSLPVKPGEYVWLVKEDIKGVLYYYWVCRKVGNIHTEDLNYSQNERLTAAVQAYNQYDNQSQAQNFDDDQISLLHALNKTSITNLPEAVDFSDLFSSSLAFHEEYTGEPVPRMSKKCGDVLLQGSNNAGIHITTEKFSTSTLDKTLMTPAYNEKETTDGRVPQSPAVDIFVHRKYSDLIESQLLPKDKSISTGNLNLVKNTCSNPLFEFYEINKMSDIALNEDNASSNEINDIIDDVRNVSCRLYMSSNTNIDEIFNSSFDVLSPKSGPSAALYSTNSRVIAESNLRLVNLTGQSFLDMDNSGNIVAKSSIDSGQQFLSLGNNGVTRIQARDKIELAVRSNNSSPSEPYILASKLENLLNDISVQLKVINTSAQAAADVVTLIAAVKAIGVAAQTAALQIDTYRSNGILRSTKIFGE